MFWRCRPLLTKDHGTTRPLQGPRDHQTTDHETSPVPLSRKIPAGGEDFRATDGTRIKHGKGNMSYSFGKNGERGEASSGNPCLIRVPSVAQDLWLRLCRSGVPWSCGPVVLSFFPEFL